MPVADLGPPVLTPLGVPVRRARVMLLNSAGVHLREDPPFEPVNDVSFRRIPRPLTRTGCGPRIPPPCADLGCAMSNDVFHALRATRLWGWWHERWNGAGCRPCAARTPGISPNCETATQRLPQLTVRELRGPPAGNR